MKKRVYYFAFYIIIDINIFLSYFILVWLLLLWLNKKMLMEMGIQSFIKFV